MTNECMLFAERDFDYLASALSSDPESAGKIKNVRAALIRRDAPTRLRLLRAATRDLAAIAALREHDKAATEAFLAQHAEEVRRVHREREASEAIADRNSRAMHPPICALKASIVSFERAIGAARSAADLAAAGSALTEAVNATLTTFETVASWLPSAA